MFQAPSTGVVCPLALREQTSIAPSTAVLARRRGQKAGGAEHVRVKKVTCAKTERSRIRAPSSAHLQWVRKGRGPERALGALKKRRGHWTWSGQRAALLC